MADHRDGGGARDARHAGSPARGPTAARLELGPHGRQRRPAARRAGGDAPHRGDLWGGMPLAPVVHPGQRGVRPGAERAPQGGVPRVLGRGGDAERRSPDRRFLRHGARLEPELRLGAAADEPPGRQGIQLLVSDAVRFGRAPRGAERVRQHAPPLLLRGLRVVRSPGPRPAAFSRAVAARVPDRRYTRRRGGQQGVVLRRHQRDGRGQLRAARRARAGAITSAATSISTTCEPPPAGTGRARATT